MGVNTPPNTDCRSSASKDNDTGLPPNAFDRLGRALMLRGKSMPDRSPPN